MPTALLSREEVIDRLITVFRQRGYTGASLSDLSQATGLGRSSLYHYFPGGKEEMLTTCLERVGQWLQENIVTPLCGDGLPQERLQTMLITLDKFYESGRKPCLLGALVTGESCQIFHQQLRAAFLIWIEALAVVLREAGIPADLAQERSEDAVIRIQGSLVIAAGMGNPAPFQRMLQQLPSMLFAPV